MFIYVTYSQVISSGSSWNNNLDLCEGAFTSALQAIDSADLTARNFGRVWAREFYERETSVDKRNTLLTVVSHDDGFFKRIVVREERASELEKHFILDDEPQPVTVVI